MALRERAAGPISKMRKNHSFQRITTSRVLNKKEGQARPFASNLSLVENC